MKNLQELNKESMRATAEMEKQIKARTTMYDVLREQICKISKGSFSLDMFEEKDNTGAVVRDGVTTIIFKLNSNFEIEVTGGDRIAYGEWFDVEKDDEHLLACAEEFQEVLYKIKEKNITLKHEGIHRVYPNESTEIIENRKIIGKFYEYGGKVWIGIDNETGDAWTEEFDTLESCIAWLKGDELECWKCGRVDSPTISVHFEFEDGTDYDELTDLEEHEVEEWIKEKIIDEGWTNVKDYGYGLYCPNCLESLE